MQGKKVKKYMYNCMYIKSCEKSEKISRRAGKSWVRNAIRNFYALLHILQYRFNVLQDCICVLISENYQLKQSI